MNLQNIAKEVFDTQAKEITSLSTKLTEDFDKAVDAVLNSQGKFIICGMGKSGIIARKIAATLASTGTPSFFLHPGEAYHGDLGMIEGDDIVMLISNSGETDEVLRIIPFLKSQQNTIIAMSNNPSSTLGKNSDYHLDISIEHEACPLSLAPMSSTTATLVMGDALAVALMKMRDFKDENFAKFHPGGSLGKRLLTTVGSVMKSEHLPICSPDTNIKDTIQSITDGKCGLCVVVDGSQIVGVITDGDVRRAMDSRQSEFFDLCASDLMSLSPKSINADERLVVASEIMNRHKINTLLVTDISGLVGVVQMYDLGI